MSPIWTGENPGTSCDAGEPAVYDHSAEAATVTVRPAGFQFTADPGQSIMAAAVAAGYRWPTICGGLGDCLVCHVEVLEHPQCLSEPTDAETQAVRELCARSGRPVRLACQAAVHGDVVVLKRGVRQGRTPTTDQEMTNSDG